MCDNYSITKQPVAPVPSSYCIKCDVMCYILFAGKFQSYGGHGVLSAKVNSSLLGM